MGHRIKHLLFFRPSNLFVTSHFAAAMACGMLDMHRRQELWSGAGKGGGAGGSLGGHAWMARHL